MYVTISLYCPPLLEFRPCLLLRAKVRRYDKGIGWLSSIKSLYLESEGGEVVMEKCIRGAGVDQGEGEKGLFSLYRWRSFLRGSRFLFFSCLPLFCPPYSPPFFAFSIFLGGMVIVTVISAFEMILGIVAFLCLAPGLSPLTEWSLVRLHSKYRRFISTGFLPLKTGSSRQHYDRSGQSHCFAASYTSHLS